MRSPRELYRLLRRDSGAKLAMLLFLLGALLAWEVLACAAEYLSRMGEPAEYVLSSGVQGAALEGKISALRGEEGVICVSRQREYDLTSGERSVTVAEVSAEYLADGFGLDTEAAGTTFFLGSDAFKAFCGAGARSPVRMTCAAGEKSVSGAFVLEKSLPGELAVTKGSSATLQDASKLRVMFRGRDFSGTDAAWIGELGLSVENSETLAEDAHETELLMVKLRYGGMACVLAVLLGCRLYPRRWT